MASLEQQGNTPRVRYAQAAWNRGAGRQRGMSKTGRNRDVRALHDEVLAPFVPVEGKGSQHSLCIRLPIALSHALAARCERTGQALEGQIRVLLAMLCSGRLKVLTPEGETYTLRGVRPEAADSMGVEFEERQAAYSAGEGGLDLAAMMPLKEGVKGEFLYCKKLADDVGSSR